MPTLVPRLSIWVPLHGSPSRLSKMARASNLTAKELLLAARSHHCVAVQFTGSQSFLWMSNQVVMAKIFQNKNNLVRHWRYTGKEYQRYGLLCSTSVRLLSNRPEVAAGDALAGGESLLNGGEGGVAAGGKRREAIALLGLPRSHFGRRGLDHGAGVTNKLVLGTVDRGDVVLLHDGGKYNGLRHESQS